MKTLVKLGITLFSLIPLVILSQVDIQPDAIAINDCNPLSELTINSAGLAQNTIHVESLDNQQSSSAIYAKGFSVTGFGQTSYAILADANYGPEANFSYGVVGSSVRTSASNNGRAFGLRGIAGNATPGANYGVFGDLQGTNGGAAVLGYDRLTDGGWSQVISGGISYAGYFRGKGYFHGNLGLGEISPQSKLHVDGGDIYVEGLNYGIILDSGSGCFRITVDAAGNLVTTSVTCP